MKERRLAKNTEPPSGTTEKNDLMPVAITSLGIVAVAGLIFIATNDEARGCVGRSITRNVPVCEGDALWLTRKPEGQSPNITVDLIGNNPCVSVQVPFTTTMMGAMIINEEKVDVQSILPEHLRGSGYLSEETLKELQRLASDGEPIWIQHPADTTEK